ncbi:hypothetical protein N9S42_01300 [Paracoccaceae bacterium]|nr:hypothetical protein [Paracoccaceae bacterium]
MIQWRGQKEPDADSSNSVCHIPGEKVSRNAQEPSHKGYRLWRPSKDWAVANRLVW